MQLKIDVVCNKTAKDKIPNITFIGTSSKGCVYEVEMQSSNGCSVASMNALWTFLGKYDGLWGALLIGVGFLMTLFGSKLFKPTICLMGAFAFIAVSLLFFYSVFFNANTKSYVGWIVLVISTILGTIVGLLL